jgi:hypothetical protein
MLWVFSLTKQKHNLLRKEITSSLCVKQKDVCECAGETEEKVSDGNIGGLFDFMCV